MEAAFGTWSLYGMIAVLCDAATLYFKRPVDMLWAV